MSGFFYNIGRRLGRAAVPTIRKGRWIWQGLAGSEQDALQAEHALGAALAAELREVSPASSQPEDITQVRQWGQQLVAQLPHTNRHFHFETLQTDTPNAFALPGGYIFVGQSLLDLCRRNPGEVAFVLAHEMAHVIHRHAWDRLVNQSMLQAASLATAASGPLGRWLRQNGLQLLQTAHSRRCEWEADATAIDLTRKAGFDRDAGIRLLERIEQMGPQSTGLGTYFSSHPPPAERIARLQTAP
jgi:predicted Zn-dependent protease